MVTPHRIYTNSSVFTVLAAAFLLLNCCACCQTQSASAPHSDASVDQQAVPEAWQIIRSLLATEAKPRLRTSVWPEPPRFSDLVERRPLSDDSMAILRESFIAATATDLPRQRANLEVLERLRGFRWPDVTGRQRIRAVIDESQPQPDPQGWLLDEGDGIVCWLTDDLRVESAYQDQERFGTHFSELKRTTFEQDIQEFLKLASERQKAENKWEWDRPHNFSPFGNAFEHRLVRLIFTAAQRGLRDQTKALVIAYLAAVPDGLAVPGEIQELRHDFVWYELEWAADLIQRPVTGSEAERANDWRQFLQTCRDLRAAYPANRFKERLNWLIESGDLALAQPEPAYLAKPRADLTEEETILLLIRQLSDHVSRFGRFGMGPDVFGKGSPASRLVLIGPGALPYLVDAVADETPCRICDYDRHTIDSSNLMCRQDIVFECLEQITGCVFFKPRGHQEHQPERRAAAVAHVRRWWKFCKASPQAKWLRVYLHTLPENLALIDPVTKRLDSDCRRRAVLLLSHLEGPEKMLEELKQLPREWPYDDDPAPLEQFLPSRPVRWAFQRLDNVWSRSLRRSDIDVLLKYGDRYTYSRLAQLAIDNELVSDSQQPSTKRFVSSLPKNRPAILFQGHHVELAAKFGQNRAIPLLFAMLRNTQEYGSIGDRRYSTADLAMDELIKLIGRDFGYRPLAPNSERLKVFEAARGWSNKATWKELGELVNRESAEVRPRSDLYLDDKQIDELVQAIAASDTASRRNVIAKLGDVLSYKIQRELLNTLDREPSPDERVHHDPSASCRVAAIQMIAELRSDQRDRSLWNIRIETLAAALQSVRTVVFDANAPPAVREAALDCIRQQRSEIDEYVLEQLVRQPVLRQRAFLHDFGDLVDANLSREEVVTSLISRLKRDDTNERSRVVEALGRLGAEAAPALQSLLEILDLKTDEDRWLDETVINALAAIRAKRTDYLLSQRMHDTKRSTPSRDAAAIALLRVNPEKGTPAVVAYLAGVLEGGRTSRRFWSVRSLAAIGADANSALPVLRKQNDTGSRQFRIVLRQSIEEIESQESIKK
jgi:hypothetical protein